MISHRPVTEHKKSGTEEADLLEVILPTLERVLQYLPDKINDLWHYHGIGGWRRVTVVEVLVLPVFDKLFDNNFFRHYPYSSSNHFILVNRHKYITDINKDINI